MGKILVVDDEDDVRLSLERRLTREGHTVQSAGSQAGAHLFRLSTLRAAGVAGAGGWSW